MHRVVENCIPLTFFPFSLKCQELSDDGASSVAVSVEVDDHGTRSGDDANAKVFFELLEKDEGEHCVRNQADPCGDETLQQKFDDYTGCNFLQVLWSV